MEHGFLMRIIMNGSYLIRPTLYLKSNVNIINGDGSKINPYTLSME